MSRPMPWGYFVTLRDLKRLDDVVPILPCCDYKLLDIVKIEKDDPVAADLWWLQFQRVEIHSVGSLFAWNEQLGDFATELGLDSYDGMFLPCP